MNIADAPQNLRGIFDRRVKGQAITPMSVEIERGRIRFFADVLGEQNRIHHDVTAATAAGFADLVAPPSFFMVVEALANEMRARQSLSSAAELVKCDYRYLLHGDERYFYHAPILAGEDVMHETRVVDFYDKKGGAMEFVTFESTISSAKRGVLVRAQRTLLHRLPEARG